MKKKIWMKPDFDLEIFVPNHYIAACFLPGNNVKIVHSLKDEYNSSHYYLFADGGNGVWDGGYFEDAENTNWHSYGDDFISQPGDHDQGHPGHCLQIATIINPAVYALPKSDINATPKSFAYIQVTQTGQRYYLMNPLSSCGSGSSHS
ncbi:MAG: hypothetical protein IKH26_05865 [Bacteroidaceae bacterium]|nr:hypothetical protein [Bacteroidaceae bacterium]